MTNEMGELLKKAQPPNGDPDSQFDLARAYMFGQDGFPVDITESIKWFKEAGNKRKWAMYNLIGIYMGGRFPEHRSAGNLIECFETIVERFGDPVDMVTLGAILCGDEYNRHIHADYGGLPELARLPYNNPAEGFRLIEKGVRIAETMPENPLGYLEYNEIYCAYHNETRKQNREELRDSCYFGRSEIIAALTKKADYAKKALVALKQGKNVSSHYTEEDIKGLIKCGEDFVAASSGELNARIEAEENSKRAMMMLF